VLGACKPAARQLFLFHCGHEFLVARNGLRPGLRVLVVNLRVIVVAAHPDDEVLGAGCAMAAHAARGDSVVVFIATDGAGARKDKGYGEERVVQLKHDAQACAKRLGVAKVVFGQFEDQRLDAVPLAVVAKALETVFLEEKPEIVYTHSLADLNRDHRTLAEATFVAARPFSASGAQVKRLLSFEVPSSTEWGTQSLKTSFLPNFFVDATRLLERKVAAFSCYSTESRPDPHPRSPSGIAALASYRGMQAGFQYAEAFEAVRLVE